MNYKEILYDYKKPFSLTQREPPIALGITKLDEVLNGGLRRRELGTVLAMSQHGKTAMLNTIGSRAFISGFNVVHMIYEDYIGDIFSAYDRILQTFDVKKESISSFLKFLDCASAPINLREIEKVVEDLRPDVLVIDYAELIPRTKVSSEEYRIRLKQVFIELRHLAARHSVALWTGHQANVQVDQMTKAPILRMSVDRISEAKTILATTDVCLGFARNNTNDGNLWCTVMKAKHRPPPVQDFFPLGVDFSIPNIWSV